MDWLGRASRVCERATPLRERKRERKREPNQGEGGQVDEVEGEDAGCRMRGLGKGNMDWMDWMDDGSGSPPSAIGLLREGLFTGVPFAVLAVAVLAVPPRAHDAISRHDLGVLTSSSPYE